jgi:integrase/recombinase XerD
VTPETGLALAQDLALVAARVESPDRHPAAVYLAGLAPGSRRTMRQALDTVAGILTGAQADAEALDWPRLRYQHTQAVRAALAARYAPATANKMLAALRGVLREAWRLGRMTAEDFHRAADLPAVRGSTLPRGRALTPGELRALFAAVAEDARPATRARDAALLAVLYGGGLRRAEVVALDVDDYDRDTGTLRVRRGKGRKARLLYATNGAGEALDAWVAVRGLEPGPLVMAVNRAGRIVRRRLTPEAVFDRLGHLAARAGVQRFSPHDLRRSFVSHLLDSGVDISTVRSLAGHASVTTTTRYDHRGEAARRKALELLHVPYVAGQ